MKTVIDVKGNIVSWIVELVIGVVSGVLSGIILTRLIPDGSMALEPAESPGGTVTQQVMAANGDVITVAGDGNHAHIGDDNSVHVNVAGVPGAWLCCLCCHRDFPFEVLRDSVEFPRDHFCVSDDDVIADRRAVPAV